MKNYISDKSLIIIFSIGATLLIILNFIPLDAVILKRFLPLFVFAAVMVLLSPIVALMLCPRYLLIPATLFFFYVFSIFGGNTSGVLGFSTNTWELRNYGWPMKYLTVQYHKGGKFVDSETNGQIWQYNKFYKIDNLTIDWLKVIPNIMMCFILAFALTIPKRLVNKTKLIC